MVHGSVDFPINRVLNGLNKGLTDLRPLAAGIGRIMIEGNRQGLGTDWNDHPLAPLAESTVRSRHGSGPPLAPQGEASRVVKNAYVQATGAGGQLVVELSWRGIPWLGFHESGTKYMPQRDIIGLRWNTMLEIKEYAKKYFNDLLSVR